MTLDKPLSSYIERPDTLNEAAIAMLQELTTNYPYFHAAQLLLCRALFQTHSNQFDRNLRITAGLVPDRKAIFHLTEAADYAPRQDKRNSRATKERAEEAVDTTASLIDNFLSEQPAEQTSKKRTKAEPSVDYMAYLMQTEDEEQQAQGKNNGTASTETLIDNFLNQSDDSPIVLSNDTAADMPSPILPSETQGSTDIFTEALARIYIKQKKYDRAVDILHKLSARNPENNRYFADQIRFLEKLILNNKYNQ